eukprot:scaffold2409_cov121-Isochrysis_galbana.AAC.4
MLILALALGQSCAQLARDKSAAKTLAGAAAPPINTTHSLGCPLPDLSHIIRRLATVYNIVHSNHPPHSPFCGRWTVDTRGFNNNKRGRLRSRRDRGCLRGASEVRRARGGHTHAMWDRDAATPCVGGSHVREHVTPYDPQLPVGINCINTARSANSSEGLRAGRRAGYGAARGAGDGLTLDARGRGGRMIARGRGRGAIE